MKTVAELLYGSMDDGNIKPIAKRFGLPYEEFRRVLRTGHVPSDKILLLYAERLGLDPALLILTAYWQKAPKCAKEYVAKGVLERSYLLSNAEARAKYESIR